MDRSMEGVEVGPTGSDQGQRRQGVVAVQNPAGPEPSGMAQRAECHIRRILQGKRAARLVRHRLADDADTVRSDLLEGMVCLDLFGEHGHRHSLGDQMCGQLADVPFEPT